MLRPYFIGLQFLTRISLVKQDNWTEEDFGQSVKFFPLIGATLGVVYAAFAYVLTVMLPAYGINMPAHFTAALMLILPVLFTGGIHCDGFMDTMDAMASWQTRERRLQILKDSHTGAFAVIGCAGYLLASAGLYSELNSIWPMLCVFVLSRSLSAFALNHLPKANPGGMLSGFADAAKKRAVDIACGIYIAVCAVLLIIFWNWMGLAVLIAAGIWLLYYCHFAMKNFGGVTGDLAGWFVQVMELACLAVLVLGGKL